ncbi:hypothetical protein WA158_002028 [Blastocystis sp. Blastoise]
MNRQSIQSSRQSVMENNYNRRTSIAPRASVRGTRQSVARSSIATQMGRYKPRSEMDVEQDTPKEPCQPLDLKQFADITKYEPAVLKIAEKLFDIDSLIDSILEKKITVSKFLFRDCHTQYTSFTDSNRELLFTILDKREKFVVQLEDLEKQLHALVSHRQTQFRDIQEKKEHIVEEYKQLIEGLSSYRKEKDQLQKTVDEYKQFRDTFTSLKETLLKRIEVLQKEKEQCSMENSEQSKKFNELSTQLKSQQDRYNALLLSAEKTKRDYEEYMTTTIKELEEEEKEAKRQNEVLRKQFDTLKITSDEKTAELNNIYLHIHKEQEDLQKDVDKIAGQLETTKKNLESEKQLISQLEMDKQYINDQISNLSLQQRTLMENRTDTEAYHRDRVKEYVSEKQKEQDRYDGLLAQIAALKKKERSVLEDMAKEEALLTIYMEKKETLVRDMAEIEHKMDVYNEDIDKYKRDIARYQSDINTLKQEKQSYENELNRSDDDNAKELEDIYNKRDQINDDFKVNKAKWDQNKQMLATRLQQLKDKNAVLKEQKELLNNDRQTYIEVKNKTQEEFDRVIDACELKIQQLNQTILARNDIVDRYNHILGYKQQLEAKIYDGELRRREILNSIQEIRGNIYICSRVLEDERETTDGDDDMCVDCLPNETDIAVNCQGKQYIYTCDHIYPQETNMDDIFQAISPYFLSALDGYSLNLLSFATHNSKHILFGDTIDSRGEVESTSMASDLNMSPLETSMCSLTDDNMEIEEDEEEVIDFNKYGLIYRILDYIYMEIDKLKKIGWEYHVFFTYGQCTEGKVIDLLDNNKRRESHSPRKSVAPNGLRKISRASPLQIISLLALVNKDKNIKNSLSPCIFSMFMTGTNESKNIKVEGKFNVFILQDIALYKQNNISFSQFISDYANFVNCLNTALPPIPRASSFPNFGLSILSTFMGSSSPTNSDIPVTPKLPDDMDEQDLLQVMCDNGKIIALCNIEPLAQQAEDTVFMMEWIKQLTQYKLERSKRKLSKIDY